MFDEQACEKALENLRILERKDNFKKWSGQVAPQVNCDVLERLVKEHFNDDYEYERIDFLSDSYIKNMTRNDLERYIWEIIYGLKAADSYIDALEKRRTYTDNKILKYGKALDKACEQLESLSYENNMMKASPYAYDCDYTKEEEWKEWCLKD